MHFFLAPFLILPQASIGGIRNLNNKRPDQSVGDGKADYRVLLKSYQKEMSSKVHLCQKCHNNQGTSIMSMTLINEWKQSKMYKWNIIYNPSASHWYSLRQAFNKQIHYTALKLQALLYTHYTHITGTYTHYTHITHIVAFVWS